MLRECRGFVLRQVFIAKRKGPVLRRTSPLLYLLKKRFFTVLYHLQSQIGVLTNVAAGP